MELSNRDFRAMIYCYFMKGLKVTNISESFVAAFGKNAVCETSVCKWYNEFKRGRKTLKDDTDPGCPVSAITPENLGCGTVDQRRSLDDTQGDSLTS